MKRFTPWLSLLPLALAAPLAVAAPADQKQLAFDAVERNAEAVCNPLISFEFITQKVQAKPGVFLIFCVKKIL